MSIVSLSQKSYHFAEYPMEYEKAIAVLKRLLDRHPLDAEEKEAIITAIGLLTLGSLSKSKIKAQKAKREQSTEW